MHLVNQLPAIIGFAIIACGPVRAPAQPTITATGDVVHVDWTQSYDAGYTDGNGAYAGGSEIMHLAAHQGKLFAANGYWVDSRWEKPP